MTQQHPLTDHEADKYLQMGWDWAIEEMSSAWENAIQNDEQAAQELTTKYPSIFAFGEVFKRMRPQQQQEGN